MSTKHWICDGDTFAMHDKEGNKYRLTIELDDLAESPREWDNVATMACWHRQYDLGDKHDYEDIQELLEYLADKVGVKYDEIDWSVRGAAKERDMKLIEDLKPYYCIKYLYLYDHSGITISTGSFNDPWDSGIVGLVYISKEKAFKEFSCMEDNTWYDEASRHIDGEVEFYDQYLRGNVWWYKLEKLCIEENYCPHCGEIINIYEEWEEEDSCGGFIGDSLEDCGILDNIPANLEFDK